jgi:hypothetical protein
VGRASLHTRSPHHLSRPERSITRVDTHFRAPYTTSLMAKSDLAGLSGTRAGASSRRSWTYWVIAAVVLLAGFADLVRGGETLAPILLIVGYCVLIPLAILG